MKPRPAATALRHDALEAASSLRDSTAAFEISTPVTRKPESASYGRLVVFGRLRGCHAESTNALVGRALRIGDLERHSVVDEGLRPRCQDVGGRQIVDRLLREIAELIEPILVEDARTRDGLAIHRDFELGLQAEIDLAFDA